MFSRRSSLSSNFFMFSLLIFGAVIVLALGAWVQLYHQELNHKREQLPVEAARVDSVFTESLDYMASYAEFLGEKIIQHDPGDLAFIANLMGGKFRTEPEEHNLFIATTFDWVTPDKQLRASNKLGVLKNPFDMSDRDYLSRTPHYPWTLQLSPPRIGGLSKQWILPAGMGLTDRQGHFVGSVTLGIALDAMNRKLAQVMGNSDIRYVILTEDLKPVLDSMGDNSAPNPSFDMDLSAFRDTLRRGARYLDEPIVYHDIRYSYYKKLSKYPYVILVGYNTSMAQGLLDQMVVSRIISLVALGAAAIVMLYYMRRRLVKPVLELASFAERIRKGEPASLPESNLQEIVILATQLQSISDYMQKERKILEELSHKTGLLEHKTLELEAANAEALAARDEAIQANRAKSEFLANISHEIRTPMNAVVGLTDILLLQDQSPERQREYLKIMQASAHQLLQLINDLLDVAKLESQQIQLEQIPFDLHEIADEVVRINEVIAREKGIKLTLKEAGPVKEALLGDPLRLRQVMINLVGNAMKFTEKGGVTVEVQARENKHERQMDITLAVSDTGIGIPLNKLETIFGKFSQADTSITRKYGGTGLGLSITKTLVDLMGGKISVSSNPGEGSCFTIELSLPLHEYVLPFAAPQPVQPAVDEREKCANFRVLLVEDNPANVLVATSLLEHLGYAFETARTGREALAKLEQENFDLVLMDVQMPEMDGFQVTKAIREREAGKQRIPIVGMTAHALMGDKQRCLAAGMDDYLSKPFSPDDFTALLRRFRRERQDARVAA